ncbi:MAG: hypothetical protein NVV57_09495 [Demequina sp.]|nr:hypothetical protein [Demequina sp.]
MDRSAVEAPNASRVSQGDIVRNIDLPECVAVEGAEVVVKITRFPYAVVLTQDCELEQDANARANGSIGQRILHVLLAPAYHQADLIAGEHLSLLDIQASSINASPKSQSAKDFMRNNNPRYHQLPLSKAGDGLPDLVVDFKHNFSVNADYLATIHAMRGVALTRLADLYREDLSQRYAAFLSRIALPIQVDGFPAG